MSAKKYKYYLPFALMAIKLITYSCSEEDIPAINFNPSVTYGTMTDQEGNVYKTVTIGTQTWMAENLRTRRYRDDTLIPVVKDDQQWIGKTTGALCYYENDIKYSDTYGCLYNWFAVTSVHDLAPEGWHIASDEEWNILIAYLGGESVAGGKMKEKGSAHWDTYNHANIASNESGFTALPGGWRNDLVFGKTFWYMIYYGRWWSSTEENPEKAWSREMYYGTEEVCKNSDPKFYGYSVRCIRD